MAELDRELLLYLNNWTGMTHIVKTATITLCGTNVTHVTANWNMRLMTLRNLRCKQCIQRLRKLDDRNQAW